MKRVSVFLLALAGLLAAGCASTAEDADDDREVSVPLEKVPPAALAAAKAAVPGITFTGAATEVEKGRTLYELAGTADGKAYEIEVTAEGKVVEVEQGDDGEDDD